MVLLTITSSILRALDLRQGEEATADEVATPEPSLVAPEVGRPISHGQVLDLWRQRRAEGDDSFSLETLLSGSRVYVPPPPPKPEPSHEYKALMARLRREEEERAYQRMVSPPAPMETYSQRFPGAAALSRSFAEVNRPIRGSDTGDDDVTYNDVHRQLMLILNVLLSVVGVAATLWVLARWWSTPARLFLAMGGSMLVGIAEVTLYSGYIWHLSEAKKKDKSAREVKEVVRTWVVAADGETAGTVREHGGVLVGSMVDAAGPGVRRRKRES